jgi:large repetitive protein
MVIICPSSAPKDLSHEVELRIALLRNPAVSGTRPAAPPASSAGTADAIHSPTGGSGNTRTACNHYNGATLTSPITLTKPTDQTNYEGDSVSLTLRATDSSGGTLRYAASGLPKGLVLNPTTGVISGTIAAGASANGPYTVVVMAQDGTYSVSQLFTWNVNRSSHAHGSR